jgi:hypothetical protein
MFAQKDRNRDATNAGKVNVAPLTGCKEGPSAVELPKWNELVSFASLVVGAPQNVFECSLVCRELAIRCATKADFQFDKMLTARCKANSRIRQFSLALSDTLVAAGGLPSDMGKRVQEIFSSI